MFACTHTHKRHPWQNATKHIEWNNFSRIDHRRMLKKIVFFCRQYRSCGYIDSVVNFVQFQPKHLPNQGDEKKTSKNVKWDERKNSVTIYSNSYDDHFSSTLCAVFNIHSDRFFFAAIFSFGLKRFCLYAIEKCIFAFCSTHRFRLEQLLVLFCAHFPPFLYERVFFSVGSRYRISNHDRC